MEGKKKFIPDKSHKLMDQVRETMRYYHYAYRTEQTLCNFVAEFRFPISECRLPGLRRLFP